MRQPRYYFERVKRFLTNYDVRFNYLCILGFYDHMTDEKFLRMKYKRLLGRELNLDAPQDFNEKLQWLKLYDRNSDYSIMVDKYEVKEYVSKKIGEEHVLPLVGDGGGVEFSRRDKFWVTSGSVCS